MTTPLQLIQDLIRCRSITPEDAGAQNIIKDLLSNCGFSAHDLSVNDVTNTLLHKGKSGPLILISGHTDVVPPGDMAKWDSPPFSPTLQDGKLYGRGSCDMKGSIAAMVCALMEFEPINYQVALSLTSDEEGASVDGSRQIAKWLQAQNYQPACTLVIEPTCQQKLGDIIKNGRRGSLYLGLKINTQPHHVAYLPSEQNIMLRVTTLIQDLQQAFIYPNLNFHLLKISAGDANNMTPSCIDLTFNWRFAENLSVEEIMKITNTKLEELAVDHQANWDIGATPYFSQPGPYGEILKQVITHTSGINPEFSQTGGASDARFFAPFSSEVIEFGPTNASIHQANENICVNELNELKNIYLSWLQQIALNQSKYLNAEEKSAAYSK